MRGATTRAECVCNLAVDATGICLKASTDVDGHIGVRPINYAMVRALAVPAKPEIGVEDLGCREFARIFSFIPPTLLDPISW